MEKMSFAERVYSLCKQVPRGKVTTYKWIADELGTKGYQAIGQVLKRNPFSPEVPCHRVVAADGSLGGFRGREIKEKIMLLRNEGVYVENNKIVLAKYGFHFLESANFPKNI